MKTLIPILKMLEIQFFKAILKYKNHPCFIAIKRKSKNSKFTFDEVDNEKIIKEIKRLNKNKASQKSDIPITIVHENLQFS